MDVIYVAQTRAAETVHAMTARVDEVPDADGKRLGKTACGRTLRGATGASIPSGVSCMQCRRALRRDGWQL